MDDTRQRQLAEAHTKRIAKCTTKQASDMCVSGATTVACKNCGASFWKHPQSRGVLCCECRVVQFEKAYRVKDITVPKEGYPKQTPFLTMEEVDNYFASEKVACLLCGHEFRGLQQHINHVHLMSSEQSQLTFGLPLSRGLVGAQTRAKHSVSATERMAAKTEDERQVGIQRMLAAAPHTGSVPTHSPAIKNAKLQLVRKGYESEKHISKTVRGVIEAPCSCCGKLSEVSALATVTHPCRILCKACRLSKHKEYHKVYEAKKRRRDPVIAAAYQMRYKERLRAAKKK